MIPILNHSDFAGHDSSLFNHTLWYYNGTNHSIGEQSMHLLRLVSALPYMLILLSIGIVSANTLVLAAFVKDPRLRTPFNTYLLNLIISDIGQAGLDLPFTIMFQFEHQWPLGRIACNFSLYTKWVFAGVVRNTHALISLNRVWALAWPVEYKQYHTRKTAAGLCLGTWVYVHVFLLPGMIPDALHYRPDDGTCAVATAAQPVWATTTQFLLYNSTLVVIAVTYPYIWWKIRQRRKKTHDLIQMTGTPSTLGPRSFPNAPGQRTTFAHSLEASNQMHGHRFSTGHRSSIRDPESGPRRAFRKTVKPNDSQSFAVLTYLVIGVIFCWSPILVFFTMADITGYDNDVYFIIGSLLYNFNSLLDPFFFCIAVVPLRVTVLNFFPRLSG